MSSEYEIRLRAYIPKLDIMVYKIAYYPSTKSLDVLASEIWHIPEAKRLSAIMSKKGNFGYLGLTFGQFELMQMAESNIFDKDIVKLQQGNIVSYWEVFYGRPAANDVLGWYCRNFSTIIPFDKIFIKGAEGGTAVVVGNTFQHKNLLQK